MIHFCRFLCLAFFWTLQIAFVVHNTTHGSYIKVTIFICGWCQAVCGKLKWQMREFPLCFPNIPNFWTVVYIQPISSENTNRMVLIWDTSTSLSHVPMVFVIIGLGDCSLHHRKPLPKPIMFCQNHNRLSSILNVFENIPSIWCDKQQNWCLLATSWPITRWIAFAQFRNRFPRRSRSIYMVWHSFQHGPVITSIKKFRISTAYCVCDYLLIHAGV